MELELTIDQVFIITGGNAGVGFQLAKILYGVNAKIYLAARSETRVADAIELLRAEFPDSKGSLLWLPLDLADLGSIKGAADQFMAKEQKLDVLWNNAGIMFTPQTIKSKQGHNIQMSTNVLGPYLFTSLLYPILKRTAEIAPLNSVRVCWASSILSGLSPQGGVNFDDSGAPILSNAYDSYFVSKAANNLLAAEFGKRYKSSKVLSVAFNPGNLNTDLTQHMMLPYLESIERILQRCILWPSRYRAYTELYAGLSPELTIEHHSGAFIWPWGRVGHQRPDIEDSLRPESEGGSRKAAKLWEWCDRETIEFA
ncbi:short-chain dehydrogenase [Penicillium sp. DV-2018c]|nr:short-chain dehydrogenase [Penicillium sp. DV-2018c]